MVIREMDTGETVHTVNLESALVRSISVGANGKITAAYGDR